MPFVTTFIVLSAAGIFNAWYLFSSRREAKPLVCPLDHDCNVVVESKWNTIFFGIRNDTLGLVYYGVLFLGILAALILPSYAPLLFTLLFWATLGGLLFSAFLVGLQMFVIKDYCFYCMISALLALLLFINSLALA
jgi:uncharacterized membrane protein